MCQIGDWFSGCVEKMEIGSGCFKNLRLVLYLLNWRLVFRLCPKNGDWFCLCQKLEIGSICVKVEIGFQVVSEIGDWFCVKLEIGSICVKLEIGSVSNWRLVLFVSNWRLVLCQIGDWFYLCQIGDWFCVKLEIGSLCVKLEIGSGGLKIGDWFYLCQKLEIGSGWVKTLKINSGCVKNWKFILVVQNT